MGQIGSDAEGQLLHRMFSLSKSIGDVTYDTLRESLNEFIC